MIGSDGYNWCGNFCPQRRRVESTTQPANGDWEPQENVSISSLILKDTNWINIESLVSNITLFI